MSTADAITALLLFALGLGMIFAPRLFAGRSEDLRLKRLEDIRLGSAERYFEEERELKSFPSTPRFLLLWRVVGAALVLGSAGVLIAGTALVR